MIDMVAICFDQVESLPVTELYALANQLTFLSDPPKWEPVRHVTINGTRYRFVYDVQQIVVNLRKSGLAILITDHNVRETLSIVDRAYLIFEGRVESEGTKDFLINDPISRQLYLGERFRM